MANEKRLIELRNKTGCSIAMCKDAICYAEKHNGGEEMAIAYLKAKTLAVKTYCSFEERVNRFMKDAKRDGDSNG